MQSTDQNGELGEHKAFAAAAPTSHGWALCKSGRREHHKLKADGPDIRADVQNLGARRPGVAKTILVVRAAGNEHTF